MPVLCWQKPEKLEESILCYNLAGSDLDFSIFSKMNSEVQFRISVPRNSSSHIQMGAVHLLGNLDWNLQELSRVTQFHLL